MTFDQPIGKWDTSSVTNMSQMFYFADSFNQPIGDWNTSSVTTMEEMFYRAESFNQCLATWNVSQINSAPYDFDSGAAFDGETTKLPDWGTDGSAGTCPEEENGDGGDTTTTDPEEENNDGGDTTPTDPLPGDIPTDEEIVIILNDECKGTITTGINGAEICDDTNGATITDDGNGTTTVTHKDEDTEVNASTSSDGTVSHKVKTKGKTSQATSNVDGAKTRITENGDVVTSVEPINYVDSNGCTIKAYVLTNKSGESVSGFVKTCNGVDQEQSTNKKETPFEPGNVSEIYEDASDNNRLKLKITTDLTKRLEL
jgi:surface protein